LDTYRTTDMNYGEEEALRWASDFSIPQSTILSHTKRLHSSNLNFNELVNSHFSETSPHRLSRDSVSLGLSPLNPEFGAMLRLADGMPLLPDNGFVPNEPNAIPPLSAAYLRLAPAVNKMIFEDFIAPGLAIILPKSLVLDHLPSFHLSRLSWTSKVGKAKGRPLVDCSAGTMPLNSEFSKLSCHFIWVNIQHPTINSLAQMVLNFWYSSVATDPRLTWCDFTVES
jgi:hypothetical protein